MDFRRICFNCMHEKPAEGGTCPYCGFRNEDYVPSENELVPMTPLNGKYIIGRALGAGGFGRTYIALDATLQVVVAVKELFIRNICYRDARSNVCVRPEDQGLFEENKKLFLNEARILAMFNEKDNEGIVNVKDFFEEKNTAYIVMEYLNGDTLKGQISRGRLTIDETMRLFDPVRHALTKVHQFGVVHMDVSPDNIMVLRDGRAKLMDFGGAKKMGSNGETGQISFKKGYTPIEQRDVNGMIGPWTDVYALAASMYFCLTGERPVDAAQRQGGAILMKPTAFGVKMSKAQENALLKAMEINPSNRFQTVEDFWNAMNVKKGKSFLIPAVAAAAVVVGVAIAFLAFGRGKPAPVKPGGNSSSSSAVSAKEPEYKIGDQMEVEPGTYIFRNVKNYDLIIGVDSGFGDDGTAVKLKKYEEANKNRFFVTDKNGEVYKLRAAHTNSLIETDVEEIGTTIRQYSQGYGLGTEKWTFIFCGHDDEKDRDKVILKTTSGQVLAPKDGKLEEGNEAVLAEYDEADESQQWYMIWNKKDESEKDVIVYHEGDLVGDIEGTFNISSSLDGLTSVCINDDPQYYKEPTAVVYKSEWLTEADAPFMFRFEPTGSETRYRVYCDKQGTDMCLEFDEATKNLYVRKKSDSKNQLFRIVYVSYNRYLLQAYNEDVVGYDLKDDGTADGNPLLVRNYSDVKDSRLESWLLVKPHKEPA